MTNPFALKTQIRNAIANNTQAESILPAHVPDSQPIPQTPTANNAAESNITSTDSVNIAKLVDDSFPFDESQLAAIEGIASQQYACLTGAAGTGKTTTTKAVVDRILSSSSFTNVELNAYHKRNDSSITDADADGRESTSEAIDETWVPSVVMVGYTGRSTQMIRRNFPESWHGNIMTIHRMLGFAPEWYDDLNNLNPDGSFSRKVRFVPTYTANFQMPWDVILIDEAGMLGLDLWNQLLAATKPGCRIIMIGDINQLPPVHGRSIFGFALSKWPSWELTHIHRQQGENNAIVDNAWRVLKGLRPTDGGNFKMIQLKSDAATSSRLVRALLPRMKSDGYYQPNRDAVLVPNNGEDGSRGFHLGQLALNRELSLIFNPQSDSPRYVIDAGRDRKYFAIGDKVMATKNDYDVGVTNGMTGVIVDIARHEGYSGDWQRFGLIEDVNKYIADDTESDSLDDFDFDQMVEQVDNLTQKKEKEKADRGPASHMVTVRFGNDEDSKEVVFATLAEVSSLMTAYVVTCHKMQGGEAPTIIIILHDALRHMLNREWLYTAITRASERCILLYTPDALRAALNKQRITGSSLSQKVAMLNKLLDTDSPLGPSVRINLPNPHSLRIHNVDKTTTLQEISAADSLESALDKRSPAVDSGGSNTARRVNPFAFLGKVN